MEKSQYSKNEEKILEFWEKENIFEKSLNQRDKNNSYVFYDGPPFATGLPHYGHILSSVIKDLIPRYQTMKGKYVARRWGWDCHGLPIENLVEKKLGVSGKKGIEKIGIKKFNETARSMVLEYVREWKVTVDRIGRWVDFDNSYKTMDTAYMESVWWVLKTIWDKKLIYKGRKVLLYCTRCETPVSNAEIAMDNSYKDVAEESLTVKFKLKSGQKFGNNYEAKDSAYILAWTTTPWTLPGNVALAVGENIEYTALRVDGAKELYIVASDLIKDIFTGKKIEIVHKNIKGKDLVGLEYEPLYEIKAVSEGGKNAWFVAPADFVTTDGGTGIVHTAVIYGEDDYNLGQKIDLPQVPLLDQSGHFNNDAPQFIRGKNYREAQNDIKKDLDERDLVYKRENHTHSYPFCWRCDSPLIYNAIAAWFINIQSIKPEMIRQNQEINWYPENLKNGRFKNILESAPDWNISRNRYWATPLPFYKCEKCLKYECIGSIEELKQKSTNFDEIYPDPQNIDLHRPYADMVDVKCSCGSKMKRIEEVIDCWVESAAMPYAQWHYPFENVGEFQESYPGQFIAEYIAQTRAWFYYMHVLGILLFDKTSFENVVATGTILSENGEKLSKSKKNFPDPAIIIDKYGADALRFYLMSSVVMQADNLFFNEADLRDIYNKVINILSNIVKFYEIYLDGKKLKSGDYPATDNILDKWIISRLENTTCEVAFKLDQYDSVKAGRAIKQFLDDLSTWWLRRSRDRFKSDESQTALAVLSAIIRRIALLISPFAPFIAEDIWQKIKLSNDPESVHLALYPSSKAELINADLEEDMIKAKSVVEIGHSLRSKNVIKVRQPIGSVWFDVKFSSDQTKLTTVILEELNAHNFSKDMKKPDKSTVNKMNVAIDTEITENLKKQGDLRELVRSIQRLRKDNGLKPGEKAKLDYSTDSDEVAKFIEEESAQIKSITNTEDLVLSKHDFQDESIVVEISSGKLNIAIK